MKKSVPEMLLELRQLKLPEKTRQYLDQVQLLLQEGMDDAVDVGVVQTIYQKVQPLITKLQGNKLPPDEDVVVPPFPAMIEEMDRAAMLIVVDTDREFIQGIKILMDMQEAITQSDAQRAQQIYLAFRRHMHLAQETRG